MKKIKILFLIHDLGPGGAEKVLVNLVNNMDQNIFDITVMTLFDVGVNRQFLEPHIHYVGGFKKLFRGNVFLMKLFSPKTLHWLFIKEKYDVEVAYLEGPSARIISGCTNQDSRLFSWIHIQQHSTMGAASSFRSVKEAEACYNKFSRIICVSEEVKKTFASALYIKVPVNVCYNTNESAKIQELAREPVLDIPFECKSIRLVGVGKLLKNKGFDRIVRIAKRLNDEGYLVYTYLLGTGPEEDNLKQYIADNHLDSCIILLGYQTNPYKYVAKCDLFVCASYQEGFSTAATEALIVGTPVCTVEVSGMKEMLGENNEYGVIVENNEDALYQGIKRLLDDNELLAHYKRQAEQRGKMFSTEKTVKAVEEMLLG